MDEDYVFGHVTYTTTYYSKLFAIKTPIKLKKMVSLFPFQVITYCRWYNREKKIYSIVYILELFGKRQRTS